VIILAEGTLSQEEIDKLLSEYQQGTFDVDTKDVPEKQIKNYDFTRPSKFGRDQLRSLETIFENYARFFVTLHLFCRLQSVMRDMWASADFDSDRPDSFCVELQNCL